MTNPFIYETHGIHVGTGDDHVKHGVDEIEKMIELAIKAGHPSITFIIHTPRLTRFRYAAEMKTNIRFIRGDQAYLEYAQNIEALRNTYENKIVIKYGVELEWLGTGLGLQWNRSKIFQADGADFIVGSVHFSKEGIPYDGSPEESAKLVAMRGGEENYWLGYIEEMIEMVDTFGNMFQVVGHLDLLKLYVPTPQPLLELDTSDHILARRMRVLLELISERHLALDLNLAGIKKGCGIYPALPLLKRARELEIPIAIGTDTHRLQDYAHNYATGIAYAQEAGYNRYISFSQSIPEKRPLEAKKNDESHFAMLNLGIQMLNRRFKTNAQSQLPRFAFGGIFSAFLTSHPLATSLGKRDAIRIRKDDKSITLGTTTPAQSTTPVTGLLSHHNDVTGALSLLFNTLASEEINVKTAFLNAHDDGTASAFLSLTGSEQMIQEAAEFVKGSAPDTFITIECGDDLIEPAHKKSDTYLLEVDGVELPMPVGPQMILTTHKNSPGVLLILLSALSSRGVNIVDLQLGERGTKGYTALSVEGDSRAISDVLSRLGPLYYEVSHLVLGDN